MILVTSARTEVAGTASRRSGRCAADQLGLDGASVAGAIFERDPDFPPTYVSVIEAAGQVTAYAHAFLDSCSALEALGEPTLLR